MTFSVSVMKKQSKNMVAKEKTASPKRRAKKQKRANIYRHRRQKPIGVPLQMFIVYAPGHFGNFPPSREAFCLCNAPTRCPDTRHIAFYGGLR